MIELIILVTIEKYNVNNSYIYLYKIVGICEII